MKFKYLLLLAASTLLVNPIPTISAPTKLAYETRTVAASSSQVYQQANPAVVTVFAGREIGSGSIVSTDGLVITNKHVVRESSQVFVRTANGERIPGQVIATDSRADLALIQLNGAAALPTLSFANDTPQAGQAVFAIGSPYGQPGVMTTGTFSRARSNGDLQSQVVLKPGNSGGPLLNALGQIVGVNKAILESAGGGNTGISIATSAQIARQFIERNRPGGLVASAPAVPSYADNQAIQETPIYQQPERGAIAPYANVTRAPQTSRWNGRSRYATNGNVVVVPQPSRKGTVGNSPFYAVPDYQTSSEAGRRYAPPTNQFAGSYPTVGVSGSRLGVMIDAQTLVIQSVEAGSAAANSGLRMGDRLVGINGAPLNSFNDLQLFMQQAPNSAAFVVDRQGRAETVMVRF